MDEQNQNEADPTSGCLVQVKPEVPPFIFNRKQYKEVAKMQLQGRWSTLILSILISYAIFFVFYMAGYIPFVIKLFSQTRAELDNTVRSFDTFSNNIVVFFKTFGWLILFMFASMLILTICKIAVYRVGIVMSHTRDKVSLSEYINGFNLWAHGILGDLWGSLWIFLWSLLLIVPGIIKAYSYSQMLFIMAEYPSIGPVRAMRLSKKITKGHKWDLFVMELSFLGWMILCVYMTFDIGLLWLYPYMLMSFTNAYHAMKKNAFDTGVITQADFQ
jgi:uncharacterized membrane protein